MSELVLSDGLLQHFAHPLLAETDDPVLISSKHRSLHQVAFQPKGVDVVSDIIELAKELADILRVVEVDRSSFQKHVLLTLATGTSAHVIMAGISMSMFLSAEERPPCFEMLLAAEMDASQSADFLKTWSHWRELSKARTPLVGLEKRPDQEKLATGFAWVCSDTGQQAQLERLACAAATLRHGYSLLKTQYDSPSKSPIVSGTELIIEDGDLIDRSVGTERIALEWTQGSRATQLDMAAKWVDEGFKVAAVNAASAVQVSGGFLTGAASALEESMCMQSTLFFSLQKAARLAEKRNVTDACGRRVHVPECGVVLSPNVNIFRRGVDHGYAPRGQAEVSAVLSVSMPNKNPQCTDQPLESRTGEDYEHLLEQKFQALLWGTVRTGAKILIMPEIGCGALGNDAVAVGKAFGRALHRFGGLLDRVLVMGRSPFYESVRAAYGLGGPGPSTTMKMTAGHSPEPVPQENKAATPEIHLKVYGQPSPSRPSGLACMSCYPSSAPQSNDELVMSGKLGKPMPSAEILLQQKLPGAGATDAETDSNPTLPNLADVQGLGVYGIVPQTRLDLAPTRLDLAAQAGGAATALNLPTAAGSAAPRTRFDLAPGGGDTAPKTRLDLVPEMGKSAPAANAPAVAPDFVPVTNVDLALNRDRVPPVQGVPLKRPSAGEVRRDVGNDTPLPKAEIVQTARRNGDMRNTQSLPEAGTAKGVRVPDNYFMASTQNANTLGSAPATASARAWATRNDNPERTECARQLGLEIRGKATDSHQQCRRILDKYGGVQKAGSIPVTQLEQVLGESRNGAKPTKEEVRLLLGGLSSSEEVILLPKLLELMRAWEIFEVFKSDINLLFYLYDGASTGRLDGEDAAHVLKEISGSSLKDEEVEVIKKQINFSPADSMSRLEFAMMVARWQALAPQTEAAKKNSASSDSGSGCMIQ